ncbi:dipeptide epimerase [Capsulimonas corticalis]|uniref:Dipeptide epimerase n=1 Tax=Capsulimonas corticalis TaxID=2219043 RepID=A0A402CYP5_9BACT|nr:dipeptide epimerase [Capsulimonas corticalis]BDI31248.1 dipeptide epimerase [Capsulimonas corticalis]
MDIRDVRITPWILPLRAPFAIAQRTAYEAQNVLIIVECEQSDLRGLGASAPVAYVTGETIPTVIEALSAFAPTLVGRPIDDLGSLLALAAEALADSPSARAGLEMALYDLWAKSRGEALWRHFGGARAELVSDMTVPIVPAAEAAELSAQASMQGFHSLKIKVGDPKGHDADRARIMDIAAAAPGVRLRIDANQAFTPEDAVDFTRSLEPIRQSIDLIEQPVHKSDLAGLKFVRENVSVPIYADESACSPDSVRRLIAQDAVDGVNVKLMKSGISGALEIIGLCRAAGKGLMLGCMLETSLGIAAAAHIAGGTGAFDFIDLDSHHLLAPIAGLRGGFHNEGDKLTLDNSQHPEFGWGITYFEADNEI